MAQSLTHSSVPGHLPAGPVSAETLRTASAPKTSFAVAVMAATLALLIGLSAVDIHWDNAPEADHSTTWDRHGHELDGRGKWAGYLKP